jgi:hypothetical protein
MGLAEERIDSASLAAHEDLFAAVRNPVLECTRASLGSAALEAAHGEQQRRIDLRLDVSGWRACERGIERPNACGGLSRSCLEICLGSPRRVGASALRAPCERSGRGYKGYERAGAPTGGECMIGQGRCCGGRDTSMRLTALSEEAESLSVPTLQVKLVRLPEEEKREDRLNQLAVVLALFHPLSDRWPAS